MHGTSGDIFLQRSIDHIPTREQRLSDLVLHCLNILILLFPPNVDDRDRHLDAVAKVTPWLETQHTTSGNDNDSGKDSITSWESEEDILRGASGVERLLDPTEN